MNELAIFTGAGGGLLASEILGWRTVCAVELDWYCRCILIKRQNEGHLRSLFPIWDDVCTFDGRAWRGIVDVISGGFPCQAYSSAASGKNTADDLWPEMRRIVADVAPRYVFAENVSTIAIEQAALDLKSLGYKTKALPFSAKDLGADHIRERYWLLAYSDDPRKLLCALNAKTRRMPYMGKSVWESDPGSTGVPDGLAYRMDRLKATGNGWVPVVAIAALTELVGLIKVGAGDTAVQESLVL